MTVLSTIIYSVNDDEFFLDQRLGFIDALCESGSYVYLEWLDQSVIRVLLGLQSIPLVVNCAETDEIAFFRG